MPFSIINNFADSLSFLILPSKMEFFIKHPDQIEVMGRNSRELVVEKFDVIKVNKTMMDAMEIFL